MTSNTTEQLPQKAALTVGYVALAVSIVSAFRMPRTGYQLSIYGSMPTAYWIGVAVALLVSVAIVVHAAGPSRIRDAGLGLLTLGSLSVVALPVLRSYHYYGAGDALSHLGWAREMSAGVIPPGDIVYPGVHLLSIQFAGLAGVPVRRAIQVLVLVALPIVFIGSFAACAYYLTRSRRAAAVGAVIAAMFVPINNISLHPVAHPSSQAVLLLPALLFALLLFLDANEPGFSLTIPKGAFLALFAASYVFIHPQESMTFLSMLGGIALLQFFVRRYRSGHPIASFRPVYAHTIVVGAIFLGWTRLHERATGRFQSVLDSLLSGRPDIVSEQTTTRGSSLVEVGGSLPELYLKLFSVTTVLMLVAGALVAALLLGLLDRERRRRNSFIGVLTAALVFPTIGFFVIFVAAQGDHYFRFHGFIMVTVSLLAAVGLTAVADWLGSSIGGPEGFLSKNRAWSALSVVLVVLLALQMLVVHPSPYIYQPNSQVSETTLEGFEVAFEHHDGETPVTGVRSDLSRYIDAHYGTTTAESMDYPGYESDVPEEIFNNNVTSHYENDRYLMVTTKNRKTDVELYNEFRYQADGFRALDTEPGANRIQDNGGFTLYRLIGTDD